jgi:hypothetical protein
MFPTIFHAASTSSRRVNSVWSPRIASSRSRSYASGLAAPKVVPYRKSMLTVRGRKRSPGTFAEKRSAIPSSGCTRMMSTLGCVAPSPKSGCGTGRKWTAISVARFGIRFPERT